MCEYTCSRVSTYPISNNTIGEALKISTFLSKLYPTDCVLGGISLRSDVPGREHVTIKFFYPTSVIEFRKYVDVLRQGCPYSSDDEIDWHDLDEKKVQETYEFLYFILRANHELPSFFHISDALRGVAAFSLENIILEQAAGCRVDNGSD